MKRCPFCAEEIQDAAVKCRFCNSMLTPQAPAPPLDNPLVPAAAPAHHEPTRVLFEGHPSWKGWVWRLSGAVLLVVIGLGLAAYLGIAKHDLPSWSPILGVVLAVVGVVWFLWLHFDRRSTHIRISTATIDIETGLFGRQIDTLQLWRIRDIDFEQTLSERIFGIARIRVLSHDQQQPHIVLQGLPGSKQLFTDLRDSIAIARQSRNVVGVVD